MTTRLLATLLSLGGLVSLALAAPVDAGNLAYRLTLAGVRDGADLAFDIEARAGLFRPISQAPAGVFGLNTVALTAEGARLRGEVRFTLAPLPPDPAPALCVLTLDVMVDGDTLKGKFDGTCGADNATMPTPSPTVGPLNPVYAGGLDAHITLLTFPR